MSQAADGRALTGRRTLLVPAPETFAATVEALAAALSRQAVERPSGEDAHTAERSPTLDALHAVLKALERTDTGRSESETPDSLGTPSPERHAVSAVCESFSRSVLVKLGGRGIAAAARRLLSAAAPDVLNVMGRLNNENTHSDLLRWLLDPRCAPVLAPHTLRALFERLKTRETEPISDNQTLTSSTLGVERRRAQRNEIPETSEGWRRLLDRALEHDCVTVTREHVCARWNATRASDGDLDRIDIVVSGFAPPSDESRTGVEFAVAIENKVRSIEHDGQTLSYERWLAENMTCWGGVFLSPSGLRPDSNAFVPISYVDMLVMLMNAYVAGATPEEHEELVLASYLKGLAKSVLRVELRALREGGSDGPE